MSEWNRNERDNDMRERGSDERQRREGGGQDRYDQGRRTEQRSFGESGQGGYRREDAQSWESYGPTRYGGGPDYGQKDFSREQSGRGYGGEGYGSQGYSGQAGQRYGSQSYGGPGYGQSYDQGYGGQRYGEDQRYRQPGGAFSARNETLQRATDGDLSQPGGGERMAMFGRGDEPHRMGEHRGRGPKNYTRSDDRIREDVNDRLSDDPWLDASEIEVQVSKCEVTLTGTANSREDRRRAEDLAEQVSGVKHVQNNIRVQQAGAQTAAGSTTTAPSEAQRSTPAQPRT